MVKPAFLVGAFCFYEYNIMSFGLCSAAATFLKLVERCTGDLNLYGRLIYLDVVIFSSTFEQHRECLQTVVNNIEKINLKQMPTKCELF